MELIKISDSKLKIMLTPSDMSHFALNVESFGSDGKKTHHAVRLLLNELRDRIGFDADDNHLSVQFFPSREGGCEMFISNLYTNEPKEEINGGLMKSSTQSTPERGIQRRHNECFLRDFAYRFDYLDNLLSVCKRLLSIGYICESSVFRDHTGRYYLFLSALSSSPFSIPDEIGFIVEYGHIENPSGARLYLREHGAPVCEGEAIVKLATLA